MSRTQTVRVPASSANLGPGFDALSLALGIHLTVTVEFEPGPAADSLRVTASGEGSDRMPSGSDNLIARVIDRVAERRGRRLGRALVRVENEIPLARGLGSSAAAILAGISCYQMLADESLTADQVFDYALEFEAHPDNLAAAYFGGLTVSALAASGAPIVCRVPVPGGLTPLLVVPDFELPTERARAVLPDRYPREDVAFNVQRAALVAAAMAQGEWALLGEAMRDRVHQPYRAPLIPGLEEILAMRREGLIGIALSGAGPTVLALTVPDRARAVGQDIVGVFRRHGVAASARVSRIDTEGRRFGVKKLKAAILGATGTVGQRMIQMLDGHPWFDIAGLAASDNSAGRPYGEAVHWQLETPIPERLAGVPVQPCRPGLECDFVLSGLPSGIARQTELDFAAAGYPVISNASSHRMAPDVPLLISEINAAHLSAIESQRARFGGKGFIVTNPNCSTIGLVLPLAALDRAFGLESVHVVTMQALSGAGYPGVASLDAIDNVIPDIDGGGEARKIETEPLKILGQWDGERFRPREFRISAMTHRVNVRDGHLEACSVKLARPGPPDEVEAAMAAFASDIDELGLPSAPRPAIILEKGAARPQPRLDRDRSGGMAVIVGRVAPCAVLDYKFRVLSHNTVRGAAGAAVLNAELLYRRGCIG